MGIFKLDGEFSEEVQLRGDDVSKAILVILWNNREEWKLKMPRNFDCRLNDIYLL